VVRKFLFPRQKSLKFAVILLFFILFSVSLSYSTFAFHIGELHASVSPTSVATTPSNTITLTVTVGNTLRLTSLDIYINNVFKGSVPACGLFCPANKQFSYSFLASSTPKNYNVGIDVKAVANGWDKGTWTKSFLIPVSVSETPAQPVIKADITSFVVNSGTFNPGDTVNATVTIKNTGTNAYRFYVGYSLQDPNRNYIDIPYQEAYLSVGSSKTLTFKWTVPSTPVSGTYNAVTAVWKTQSGGKLSDEVARQWKYNAFSVSTDVVKGEITSFTVSPGTFRPEDTVRANITVKNTGTKDNTFYVKFSVRDSGGVISDTPYQQTFLTAGASKSLNFSWKVPSTARTGAYDATAALFKTLSGGQPSGELDREWKYSAFSVTTALAKTNYIRGFFIRPFARPADHYGNPHDINTVISDIKRIEGTFGIDIDAAYVNFRSGNFGGDAFQDYLYYQQTQYPSVVVPYAKGNDFLKTWIKSFHDNNIKVHAWITLFNDNMLLEHPELIGKTRAQIEVPGCEGFVNPAIPEVRNFELSIIKEIAANPNYNIDGINLDYVRYPERNSTCNPTVDKNVITNFVAEVKNELAKIEQQKGRDIVLSADLFTFPADASVGQDVGALAQHIEFLHPMIYNGAEGKTESNLLISGANVFYSATCAGKGCKYAPATRTHNLKVNRDNAIDKIKSDISTSSALISNGYVLFEYSYLSTYTTPYIKGNAAWVYSAEDQYNQVYISQIKAHNSKALDNDKIRYLFCKAGRIDVDSLSIVYDSSKLNWCKSNFPELEVYPMIDRGDYNTVGKKFSDLSSSELKTLADKIADLIINEKGVHLNIEPDNSNTVSLIYKLRESLGDNEFKYIISATAQDGVLFPLDLDKRADFVVLMNYDKAKDLSSYKSAADHHSSTFLSRLNLGKGRGIIGLPAIATGTEYEWQQTHPGHVITENTSYKMFDYFRAGFDSIDKNNPKFIGVSLWAFHPSYCLRHDDPAATSENCPIVITEEEFMYLRGELQMFNAPTSGEIIRDGILTNSYSIKNVIQIFSGLTNLIFQVRWGGSDIDVVVETPNGTNISRATIGDVEFTSTATSEYYKIANPDAGNWTVYINPIDIPASGENYTFTTLTESPTDLFISPSDISFSNSAPLENTVVQITANVHNLGGQTPTGGVNVSFYDGAPGNSKLIGSTLLAVPVGGSATAQINWIATLGTQNIYVSVDPSNLISESNESNNIAFKQLTVKSGADVAVFREDVTFSPETPLADELIVVNITLHNLGDTDSGLFRTGLIIEGVKTITEQVLNIPSHSTYFVNHSFTLPVGKYRLKVFTDIFNVLSEPNETNNIVEFDLEVFELRPPVIAIRSPLQKGYSYKENLTLDFSATAEAGLKSISAQLDTTPANNGDAFDLFNFTLGKHNLTVTATDNLGRTVKKAAVFSVIDRIPPETSANIIEGRLGNNEWFGSDVKVELTAKDEKSGLKETGYNFDNSGNFLQYTEPVQIANEGTTTLYYRSIDNAGILEGANPFSITTFSDGSAKKTLLFKAEEIVNLSIPKDAKIISATLDVQGKSTALPTTPSSAGWEMADDGPGEGIIWNIAPYRLDNIDFRFTYAQVPTSGWEAAPDLSTIEFVRVPSNLAPCSGDYSTQLDYKYFRRKLFVPDSASSVKIKYSWIDDSTQARINGVAAALGGGAGGDRFFIDNAANNNLINYFTKGAENEIVLVAQDSCGTDFRAQGVEIFVDNVKINLFSAFSDFDIKAAITQQAGNAQNYQIFGKATALGETVSANLEESLNETVQPLNTCMWAGYPTPEWNSYSIARESIIPGQKYRITVRGGASGAYPGISAFVELTDPSWKITTFEKQSIAPTMALTYDSKKVTITYTGGPSCSYCACRDGGTLDVSFIVEKFEIFPLNPNMDAGADGDYEWQHSGALTTKVTTPDFSAELNEHLRACADASGVCTIPLKFFAQSGNLEISNLNIQVAPFEGNIESLKNIIVKIDKSAPTIITNIPRDWMNETVEAKLTAEDNLSGVAYLYYCTDKENTCDPLLVAENTSSYNFTITDENVTYIRYYAVDNANNVGQIKSSPLKIDKTPPEINIFSPRSYYYYYSEEFIEIAYDSFDSLSGVFDVIVKLDGVIIEGTFATLRDIGIGLHKLLIEAWDNAGNYATGFVAFEVFDDTTPPVSTATWQGEQGNNEWYITDVTIEIEATDDQSGVARIEYDYDDEFYENYNNPVVVSREGETNFTYRAIDRAGNEEELKLVQLKIDKTPPEIEDDSPSGWYKEDIIVTLSASDSMSGIAATYYCVTQTNNCDPNISGNTINVSEEGRNYINYYAEDNAGLTSAVKTAEVLIDRTPPNTIDNAPAVWVNKDVTVTLSATDSASGVAKTFYSIDGAGFVEGTVLLISPEGAHTIKYYSIDVAGNVEAQKTATVRIDRTAPSTTAAGIDSLWHNSNIQITLSSSDNLAGINKTYYTIYHDGVTQGIKSLGTNGQPIITYEDDDNWIEYWSTDNAENEEVHTIKKQIKLDKTKPNVDVWLDPLKDLYSFLEPLPVQYSASDPQVQGTPSNSLTKVWDIDGTVVQDPTNITNWLGTHTLTLKATDLAGNSNSDSVQFTTALELVGEDQLKITPEVLKVNPGILTVHINFPAPYEDAEILSGVCDYAQHVDIAGHNIKFEREDIEEALAARGETLDIHFEVNGTFSYNGHTYMFKGSDNITRIED